MSGVNQWCLGLGPVAWTCDVIYGIKPHTDKGFSFSLPLDMKIERIALFLLLAGYISCSPTRRPLPRRYGSDYYSRLNLDKMRTSGLYGQRTSEGAIRGSFSADSGRRDDGTRFAQAQLSAGADKNSTLGIGVGDVHAGGEVIASGRGDLKTKLESGRDFARGEVGSSVNGSIITMGAVSSTLQGSGQLRGEGDSKLSRGGGFEEGKSVDSELSASGSVNSNVMTAGAVGSTLQGSSQLRGEGDSKLSARVGFAEGGKSVDGELAVSGRGNLRGDIGINGFREEGSIDASGEGKISANAGLGRDASGAYVGGELETDGHGKLSADGGMGSAGVDGSNRGTITAGASYGKTDNSIHAGGQLDGSEQGSLSSNMRIGDLQGDIDVRGSGDGSLTAGGKIARDENSGYAGSVIKTASHGDVTSQFRVGDYRGEGHLHAEEEDGLAAWVGAGRDKEGMRVGGKLEGKKNITLSSENKLGYHSGYGSISGVGNGKVTTGVEFTSNDTVGHANSHLGGAVIGDVVSSFGVDKLRGRTDTSGGVWGNITGDAIMYSDETGVHGNTEGKVSGKVGVATKGNVGSLFGKGDATAKGETKVGAGTELVSDHNGVRAESHVRASNQGMFSVNARTGSNNDGALTGYGSVNGDGDNDVTFSTAVGEDTSNTLYARSRVVGSTGGKTSGSFGIMRNRQCGDGQCDDERVVFTDAGAEGKGKISATAGVSLDQDDTWVAAEEVRATGHGGLSGRAGLGKIQGSGAVGLAGDGKIYGNAGLLTDDDGGIQVVAEKGTKGKANITTDVSLVGVNAHGNTVFDAEGKVFTGASVSKDTEGGRLVIGDIGSEATGNVNSSATVGGIEAKGGVRGTTGSKVTFLGDYVRQERGRGEVLAEGEGKLGAGIDLRNHGHGAVEASGHGVVSADADMRRSGTGDIMVLGTARGALGGALSADGTVAHLQGGTGINAAAQGSVAGKFNRTKEHGVQASVEAKTSTSSGFRWKFWG